MRHSRDVCEGGAQRCRGADGDARAGRQRGRAGGGVGKGIAEAGDAGVGEDGVCEGGGVVVRCGGLAEFEGGRVGEGEVGGCWEGGGEGGGCCCRHD